MAAYIMALAKGEIIKAIHTKYDTIRKYLCKAIALSMEFESWLIDPNHYELRCTSSTLVT